MFVVLMFFLALLRNHCYSFHRTKWRLVTSICRGPDQSKQECRFFRRNSNPLQIFQLWPKRETSSSCLGDRLEKRSIISPLNRAICAGLRGTSGNTLETHLCYVNYISPFPRNVSLGRLWPRTRKFNRLLHLPAGKAIISHCHALITLYVQFLCSDWSKFDRWVDAENLCCVWKLAYW